VKTKRLSEAQKSHVRGNSGILASILAVSFEIIQDAEINKYFP
jgi:hypothetical protein